MGCLAANDQTVPDASCSADAVRQSPPATLENRGRGEVIAFVDAPRRKRIHALTAEECSARLEGVDGPGFGAANSPSRFTCFNELAPVSLLV